MRSLHEVVRDAESNFLSGSTHISEHVNWSLHETLEKIDAYLNSRHTSGPVDSLGREKPFFNIVSAACNIWYRATDLDRKDIRILPDKISNTVAAFLATVHLQEWMKRARFGQFLNLWGRALARYGSAVVKFVEKDGELMASVVPWNRLIVDPVDFDAIPKIEKFYLTPAQLLRKATKGDPEYAGYDFDKAKELTEALQVRKTMGKQEIDSQSKFVELYEVHGEMDARLLDDKPDLSLDDSDISYIQQMHVISFVKDEKTGDFNDYTLFKGKERQDPYMITHLIEEQGRTLAIGAVEYLFDAQWMANHSMKNMKDTLDLSSKLIFQTADTHFVGRNVLSAIEAGDIMVHDENKPLERVANDKPDIVALRGFLDQWTGLAMEITSTPEAMRGGIPPAHTSYRLQALTVQQANSLFELMTENKGLAMEDMLRRFVLPFLIKQMNNSDELISTLDEQGVAQIDAMFVPKEAVRQFNNRTIQSVFDRIQNPEAHTLSPIQPFNQQAEQLSVQQGLAPLGNKRSFSPDDITWKDFFKDFEWEVEVEVTSESQDKQALMTTLSTMLQTIATNPAILQDPNAKLIFSTILNQTGAISPLQLSTAAAQPAPMSGIPTTALPATASASKTVAAPLIGA